MSSSSDQQDVLQWLDDDYRADLSIHLYSSILLNRIDPLFPKSTWGSWPLPADEVPIPKTSLKYADTIVSNTEFEHDIDVDFANLRDEHYRMEDELYRRKHGVPLKESRRKRKNTSDTAATKKQKTQSSALENDIQEAEETSPDENDDDDLNDENSGENDEEIEKAQQDRDISEGSDGAGPSLVDEQEKSKPINSIKYLQHPSNSKSDLVNEIAKLIEKSIAKKFRKAHAENPAAQDISLSDELSSAPIAEMSKQVAHKVDKLLNSIYFKSLSKAQVSNMALKSIKWQQILLSGISAMESPYTAYKPETYANIYETCEEMFEKINYNYEFETSDDDSQDRVLSKTPEQNEDEQDIADGKFDVIKYLQSIPTAQYQDLTKMYMEKRNKHLNECRDLKTTFMGRLDAQTRLNNLYWGDRTQKFVRKVEEKNPTPEQIRNTALNYGSNQLDGDAYYLEDYR